MDIKYYYNKFGEKFKNRVELLRARINREFPEVEENFRKYYISYSKGRTFCYVWFTTNDVYIYLRLEPNKKIKLEKVPKGVNLFFKSRLLYSELNQIDIIIELIRKSKEAL